MAQGDLGTYYIYDYLFVTGKAYVKKVGGKTEVTSKAEVVLSDYLKSKWMRDAEASVNLADELVPVHYINDVLSVEGLAIILSHTANETIVELKDELSKPTHILPTSEAIVVLQDSMKYWICGVWVEATVVLQDSLTYVITGYKGWQKTSISTKQWTKE